MKSLLQIAYCAAILACLFAKTSAQAQQKKANEPTWGTLEGRFVYPAKLPEAGSLLLMKAPPPLRALLANAEDKGFRLDGFHVDPKSKGIADVMICLKRPKGNVLPIHENDKKRKEILVLDSPLGVFEPRVSAYYPEWFDGKAQGETSQQFRFKNSSPVGQNIRLTGHPRYNEGFNRNLPPQSEFDEKELNKSQRLRAQPLALTAQSDLYRWMQAYVWVFDHPYFAITKADGTFIIPRVPVGMEVQVMAWHESQGWLFTREGKTMTLKEGKNVLDFTIKAP